MERGNDGQSHPALNEPPSNLIGGRFVAIPGSALRSIDPARPARTIWTGAPSPEHVDDAVAAARAAQKPWSRRSRAERAAVLMRFRALALERADLLASLIRDEVGKVAWDARSEAQLLASKIDAVLDESAGLARVAGYEVSLGPTRGGRCFFRPHGVMAVIGPFNFPVHLPNGHIAPALLMGNAVVFKPSDKAPACGQALAELWHDALRAEHAPTGVVNLVQGGADVASALARHEGVDGVLFTGSFPVGRRILEANLDRPGCIIALEMGGNNAAIVLDDAHLALAAVECVRSAFITSGQRCTCTRRLIVQRGVAPRLIPAVCKAASALIVGDPAADHPVFMGPVISDSARRGVVSAFARLRGEVLVEPRATEGPTGGFYLTPGVVRVDGFSLERDEEIFGPVLQVCVVESLEHAIEQANNTRYGLVASIFTHDSAAMECFLHDVRAGCLNINTGTTGASGRLPFGGLGLSGNHRPAGAFSLDYCAYPVAGIIDSTTAPTVPPGMHFDPHWL